MNTDTPLQSNAMTDDLVKGNYICIRYCIFIISEVLWIPCTALLQYYWWSPKYRLQSGSWIRPLSIIMTIIKHHHWNKCKWQFFDMVSNLGTRNSAQFRCGFNACRWLQFLDLGFIFVYMKSQRSRRSRIVLLVKNIAIWNDFLEKI